MKSSILVGKSMSLSGSKYEHAVVRNRIADAETMAIRLMVDLIVTAARDGNGFDMKLTQEEAARVKHIVQRLDTAAADARQLLDRDD